MSTYEPTQTFGAVFSTPLGPITVKTDENSIIALHFGDLGLRDQTELLAAAQQQLQAYFSGSRREFDLPLRYAGTAFQNRTWSVLRDIPYGTTISYRDLAQQVDSPRGFRAVGSANGKNPLPILIPCHRVINHDGGLGGYSGGLPVKTFLLELEKSHK